MKHLAASFASAAILLLFSDSVSSQICASLTPGMGRTYNQDFDTLANSRTSSVVPAGFGFIEINGPMNTLYTAGSGGSSTGDTYSFGATGSTERAFGMVRGSSLQTIIGACFVNNTGVSISAFSVVYDGEQWRLSAPGRADRLDFQYSTDAASLTSGSWTDVDALDFSSPNITSTTTILDGNLSGNRTAGITSTITSLSIPDGAVFYLRYVDFDVVNSDDGLAIDNFLLRAFAAPSAASVSLGGHVTASSGRGIRNAIITVEGGNLKRPREISTGSFGYFRFDELAAGMTYVVTVNSKRFTFADPTRVINLNDTLLDADFQANPR